MKIKPECIPCLISRAKFEADLAEIDDRLKIEALKEFINFLSKNLNENVVPAFLGTYRYRIIRKYSKKRDLYEKLKRKSNELALTLIENIKKEYHSLTDKKSFLLKLAAIANGIEFGVKEHKYPEDIINDYKKLINESVYGNLYEALVLIEKYNNILYILDNSGEFIIDIFVTEMLRKEYGKRIVLAAKSDFILDDVTIDEVKNYYNGEIVSSGKSVGVNLDEADDYFKKYLFDKNFLIISKGMGNYESLSEIEDTLRNRLIYILRAKCSSVAKSLNVPRGAIVIKKV